MMGGTESQLHVSTNVKTVCESGKNYHVEHEYVKVDQLPLLCNVWQGVAVIL